MTDRPGSTTFPVRIGVNAAVIEGDSVLVVTYDDEDAGRHHNLPGGGVEADEAVGEALQREVLEETGEAVAVDSLLGAIEYVPVAHDERYGPVHKLELVFRCERAVRGPVAGPTSPDPNQVDAGWIDLSSIDEAPLYPPIGDRWLEIVDGATVPVIDDW